MADSRGGDELPGLLAMAGAGPQSYGTWSPVDYSQAAPQLYSGGGDTGLGGGGGMGSFNPPPDLAKYFDASGEYKIDDPRQVAAEGGISLAQLAGGIMPRWKNDRQGYEYPSDQGGFFKIEDLFGLTGPATLPQQLDPNQRGAGPPERNPGHISVPQAATYGMSRPSTNNWRLLGMGPGWIMRNGMLIDPHDQSTKLGYRAGGMPTGGISGEQYVPFSPLPLGGGTSMGVPNLVATGASPSKAGWPGATSWPAGGGWLDAGLGG